MGGGLRGAVGGRGGASGGASDGGGGDSGGDSGSGDDGGDDYPDDDDDEGGPGCPGPVGGTSGPRCAAPRTLIIINAESLRRGTTEGDELCEIDGIGPVSVAAATELLSEGGFQYLVKEGFDIKTVTKSTRVVAQLHRYGAHRPRPCLCATGLREPARPRARPLAGRLRPRRPDRARQPRPALSLLPQAQDRRRLAPRRSARGLEVGRTPKPPSAQQMARNRKVAVAKAKAFVKKDPSGPRRT